MRCGTSRLRSFFATVGPSQHMKGSRSCSGSHVDMIDPAHMWWLWPCRPFRLRNYMTSRWSNYRYYWFGALIITTVMVWLDYIAVRSLLLSPDPDQWNLWFDGSCARILNANVHSSKSKVIGNEIFVVLCERRLQTEDSFVIPDSPSSTLPAPTHPPPQDYFHLSMKIPCHLIKASLNYSWFCFCTVFYSYDRWDLDMKWNYWSYQCNMAKLTQTKAICLYSPGEVWEQPHYTVAWINLEPLSLPFTLGAWYNVLQAS